MILFHLCGKITSLCVQCLTNPRQACSLELSLPKAISDLKKKNPQMMLLLFLSRGFYEFIFPELKWNVPIVGSTIGSKRSPRYDLNDCNRRHLSRLFSMFLDQK